MKRITEKMKLWVELLELINNNQNKTISKCKFFGELKYETLPSRDVNCEVMSLEDKILITQGDNHKLVSYNSINQESLRFHINKINEKVGR